MNLARLFLVLIAFAATVRPSSAQTPAPPPPPPLWDTQLGAAFVGTSGNTDTSTFGADFSMHRRWPLWQIESLASAVVASDHDVVTAERYLAAARGRRKLAGIISLTTGERLERERLAGISLRSILDLGLGYALQRSPRWTLDAVTAFAWNHENRVGVEDDNDPIGVLQMLSKYALSATADSTQRFTFYPNFSDPSAYRAEGELTAQAAMNDRLGLKVGYLWRRSNDPVPGFVKNDSTMTASIVLKWTAAAVAP
jgi:putative salt-induced outer membrane protein YdiY